MDRMQAMTAFLSVVDTGGFASAARKLNVSPSVVTRMVGELEDTLGVRLLTRTTRIVRVTDAGVGYAESCRRILADMEEADLAVAGAHSLPRGLLSITASVMFGRIHVTPIVTEYLQRHPDVDVRCWFLDRVVNLVDEGFDLSIRIGELADSSMHAVKVGSVRRVVCASPEYLEQHGEPDDPADLERHVLVSASGGSSLPQWRFRAGVPRMTGTLKARMTTTTNDTAIAAALSGFGVTQVLSYQVAQHVADGRLKVVLEAFEPPRLPVHVVHREGRHAASKVRVFVDLAVERLRGSEVLK
ncbi:LysR substrate-binding domain-containing protein [Paraburkholderia sp.]|uniref:LysR substrate-binding domain-containing protein n=1 Tax=Paraburkholderia sp. TaxID=1926495 RepID=UPI0023875C21|nr:LysR substrate-binding domain-containing protein [Paraburkholderia sp.]MDE1182504.1 LysR substrate-binding domain-containing protein [Paraburkholderia sp.]